MVWMVRFLQTFVMGMKRLSLKDRMALVRSTTNTTNAAFSKSVSCISSGRNSTRQPMLELGGGGLNRMLCQLVDWMFYVWGGGERRLRVQ